MLWRLAARNLVQARRRTALLFAALAAVAGLLAFLQAMSAGIRDNLLDAATLVAGGHVVVGGFYKVSPGTVAPLLDDAAALRALVEQNTPGLDHVVDRSRGWARVLSGSATLQCGLIGVDFAREPDLATALDLAPERSYRRDGGEARPGDVGGLARRDGAVLFASQARRLGVGVGDRLTLQAETVAGQVSTADVEVVAVARDAGMLSSFSFFVSQELVRGLYGLDADTTGAIWVYLRDVGEADAAMARLREVLGGAGHALLPHDPQPFFFKLEAVAAEDWVGQRLDLSTWADEVSFMAWVLRGFDAVTGATLALLCAIVAVGVANAMANAVHERTREIGAMRAIGMTRARVAGLFLAEGALLGLSASGLGAGLGALLAHGAERARVPVPDPGLEQLLMSDTMHFVLRPTDLLVSVAALTLLTTLASLGPALRAARQRPAIALGHVS